MRIPMLSYRVNALAVIAPIVVAKIAFKIPMTMLLLKPSQNIGVAVSIVCQYFNVKCDGHKSGYL